MKKLITVIFTLLIYNLSLSIDYCSAQWQSDMRLTNGSNDSKTSFNNAWCIASSGNYVHLIYMNNLGGNYGWEIFYKRSTDGGQNWGPNTQLTNNYGGTANVSIAVSGSIIHIVWEDYRDWNGEIYYKRSTDNGSSWGTDTRLSNYYENSESWYPSLSVSGSIVHVVWMDERDTQSNTNWEIYYKRSTDNGSSWGTDTRLTNDPGWSIDPSVSVSGSNVNVVWNDDRDASSEIYSKYSTDGGSSWSTDLRLTNNPAYSLGPCVAVSSTNVHVVWYDYRDGNQEIYYKRSTNGGINWGTDVRLTNNPSFSGYPSISISGQVIHVVWDEGRDGNDEIYYKRSTNGGSSWGADTRLTNNSADSYNPSVAVSGSVVHVVWTDRRNGNDEIYYKRNPTGNIGIKNISLEIPSSYSLIQNYPNPFNPTTNIRYEIPVCHSCPDFIGINSSRNPVVTLKVFDALGREVETLVNEKQSPGTYETTWDASKYPSGVYFYRLTTEGFSETKKMILLK